MYNSQKDDLSGTLIYLQQMPFFYICRLGAPARSLSITNHYNYMHYMSISLLALFVHSMVRAVVGSNMYRNIKFCSHCNFYMIKFFFNFTLIELANFIDLSALSES